MESAQKALLRGHSAPLTDICFHPSAHTGGEEPVKLLASASSDGSVCIWELKINDEFKTIEHTKLCSMQVSKGDDSIIRLSWHPQNRDIIAVSADHIIGLIHLPSTYNKNDTIIDMKLCSEDNNIEEFGKLLKEHQDTINGIEFSVNGSLLASCSNDGCVKLWSLEGSCVASFVPHDRAPVIALTWINESDGNASILTAGPFAEQIRVWSLDEKMSGSGGGTCIQTIVFVATNADEDEEAFFNHFSINRECNILTIANSMRKNVYSLHYDLFDGKTPTFDYFAKFTVAMPLYNFCTIFESNASTTATVSSPSANAIMKLYCIQSEAIQQYTLELLRCLPPSTETDSDTSTSTIKRVEQIDVSSNIEKDSESSQTLVQKQKEETSKQGKVKGSKQEVPVVPTKIKQRPKVEEQVLTPGEGERKEDAKQETTPTLLTPNELLKLAMAAKEKSEEHIEEEIEAVTESDSNGIKDTVDDSSVSRVLDIEEKESEVSVSVEDLSMSKLSSMMTEMLKDNSKQLEASLTSKFAATQNKGINQLKQQIEKERKARDAAERERQEQLLVAISENINVDLPRTFEKLLKKYSTSIQKDVVVSVVPMIVKTFAEQVVPTLISEMRKALKSVLGDITKPISDMATDTSSALIPHLQDAIRSSFELSLIPQVEAGINEMMAQLAGGIEAQVQSANAKLEVDTNTIVESLRHESKRGNEQIMRLLSSLQNSSHEKQLKVDPKRSEIRSVADIEHQMDPTINLSQLMKAGKFEEAFNEALSQSNVESVTWLIQNTDVNTVIPKLSQGVLLSLIQQLSSDLRKIPETKMNCIQTAALALDPTDKLMVSLKLCSVEPYAHDIPCCFPCY